ncbi:methyl-accepting chemotaxis protein, partial [Salmonella enterica subsp. enterica]|nr:methyl-accepting chemotaxis protein [Salmonella enterica subsp. enterica serovar Bovismorbificans]
MDTKTSTLSTNTNSPVAVGPGNSNYRMDRGRSTNWIFWASICGGVAALAFIYRLY